MDEKVSFVIDSIKKLLALKVSDEEIVSELNGVGISKQDALDLIAKAKEDQTGQKVSGKTSEAISGKIYDETSSKLTMNEQVVSQLDLKENEKQKKQVDTKYQKNEKNVGEKGKNQNISSDEVDFGLKIKGNNANKVEETNSSTNNITKKETVVPKLENPIIPNKEKTSEEKLEESLKNLTQKNNPTQSSVEVNKKETQTPLQTSYSNYQNFYNQKIDSSTQKSPSRQIQSETDALWKKGIVVAVNSKLVEMKKLKDDIEINIQDKVDIAVKKEVTQLKVLLDSQKELIIASNKAALEEKQKEISFIIDSKIVELKQVNKQLATNLAAIDAAKKEQQVSLDQIKQMLDEARKTKAQLLVEMNSELIKSKSQAQAFLDNADKHLRELDERVNRTLELQKNIADGMVAQAEQKIEELTLQKTDELVDDLEIRLNKLKVMESEINPELLMQKIKVLDDFKKQFIETMKENISQINSAIEELNKKNESLDQTIQQKMLILDAKIEELTKFEKDFTMMMNNTIEKL